MVAANIVESEGFQAEDVARPKTGSGRECSDSVLPCRIVPGALGRRPGNWIPIRLGTG